MTREDVCGRLGVTYPWLNKAICEFLPKIDGNRTSISDEDFEQLVQIRILRICGLPTEEIKAFLAHDRSNIDDIIVKVLHLQALLKGFVTREMKEEK